ncbi:MULTISPECIES: sensor histidine kinase [unclassified Streptomyces]|uniref:sensor histidine kinase n=1 Tax=unclassified Streptomyces TaxID=2593676 RepID=UPI001F04E221|nr:MULTISPECIES: sensor histidine kinase [unclassified Streptomyces]MCH0562980.1 sensor histidine kinase [Streptomyces sp. MUM 2J]MCH0571940.1 sensor histidine kinase [Streptomyces sp. MUM 136J]
MLRTVSWLLRAGAYVFIGLKTYTHAPALSPAVTVGVVGYVLSGLAMLLWWRTGSPVDDLGAQRARRPPWLTTLLGTAAVVCGYASVFPNADALVGLSLIFVADLCVESTIAVGWTVAGCTVTAVEAGVLAAGASRATALGYPVLVAMALIVSHNRRAYRIRAEQSAALLAQTELLRAEQRRTAVLDERTRIAREIHDVLAHSLGALSIQIQAAGALLANHQDIDRAVTLLTEARRLTADGLAETRRAVHALRSDVAPLDVELAAAADTHRQRHGVLVRLTVEGEPAPLSPDQTLPLFRTAREALTNAAKHAPAQPVAVTLTYEDDHVALTVDNPLSRRTDGEPRFATVDGGYGLTGMRERLLLLGGTLDAGVRDGQWRVRAEVPR